MADLDMLGAYSEVIDVSTFEQILDMDDDPDDREFSQSIVFGFLEQAEQTFDKMESALEKKDLPELSSLGHFLKGSSATLGLIQVRDACEKIQHYGHKKNETGEVDEPDEEKCLSLIRASLKDAKKSYGVVESLMRRFFADKS